MIARDRVIERQRLTADEHGLARIGDKSVELAALPLRISRQVGSVYKEGKTMKTAISAALFLTLSIAPTSLGVQALFAQSAGSPAEKDFVSGGRIEMTLESGDYDIRASSDNRIHVRWNEASSKGVRVRITTNGKSADLRVENTPRDNFHATIEVPVLADVRLRLTAGNVEMAGIKGDKDIEANAGNLNINVGSSSDWGDVDASVTAGDLHAPAFKVAAGGLFRSIKWKGPGKYRLHLHLMAGDINLRN